MKKYIALILSCVLMVLQWSMVFAEDFNAESEQYEMVEMDNDEIFTSNSESEVEPYLMYIANVYTSIVKISSNQVGIRGETVCSQKVKSIKVNYSLQKWNGSEWVDVATKRLMTQREHLRVIQLQEFLQEDTGQKQVR